MTPDPLPVALPELLAPFDWCYEWDGPFGTRKFSTAPHNGRRYDRSVALFTADQMRDYATQSVSAALSARAGKLPELPTVAWAYTALYVPNPHLDDGIRVVRESRVAEVNGDPQSIAPLVRKSDAEAALRAQAEEVAALRADAERYRWWREQWCLDDPEMPDAIVHAHRGPDLDAAIDDRRQQALTSPAPKR